MYEALVVSAGTATSTRGRGEANSFNVLRLEKERVEIDRYAWNESTGVFGVDAREAFERRLGGWVAA